MIKVRAFGIEESARLLMRKLEVTQSGLAQAVLESQVALGRACEQRITFQARRVNDQDAPAARSLPGRTPVKMRFDKGRMLSTVEVSPFWVNARSSAVAGVYESRGAGEDLIRQQLVVKNSQTKPLAMPRTITFLQAPRLRAWAEAHNQLRRAVIRLTGPVGADVRYLLILGPAFAAERPGIESRIQAATQKGMRS